VAIFNVNQTTGRLTYLNKLAQGVGGITSLNGVRSLAINPDGKYLYASAISSNAVTAFSRDVSTGLLTVNTVFTNGVGGIADLSAPSGMMMDPLSRNLYVSGQNSASIVVFESPVPAVVLSTNEVTTSNNVAVFLDPTLDIKDADSDNLRSATVKISNGMSADLLSVNSQNGVSASYDANTRTLSLVGIASLSQYIDILRSLSYTPSPDPSVIPGTTSYRAISVSVIDEENNSSADAVISVKINPQNTVPTITFPAIADKFYGDPDFNIIAQSSNPLQAITFTSSDINIAEIVAGQIKIKKAGTVTITATQDANSGFDAAIPVSQTLTVKKAPLGITADAQSKVYGSTDPTLTYQITSGKLIGTDQLTGTLARDTGEDVGTYTINQGTLNASANYTLTYQKADFDITKASLTVTADAQSKVYGTNDPTLTYQITSGKLIGSDKLTGNLSRVSGENVGTYSINQGTLNASTNYDFTYQNANFDITKAGLTVTADSKSKIYGTNDPALTYQITAGKLIGNDKLTGALTRDAGENVGNYPITQGTLTASANYNFTYQKADLAITKASLTVTADPQSKVYGTNDPALTYQITSGQLIGSDVLTGNLSRVSGENVGNYTINQGTLNASPNYNFTYQKADLAITPASLTVTADAKSKVYGTNDPSLTYQITSGKLIGTDQLTGSLARDAGEDVGNYTINQGTLNASTNYNFTYQKADLAITPASLTVTADAKSKVYGTNDPSLTYKITSGKLIGTDQLTGGLARDLGEDVGSYVINQGTLAASPNYNFTYQKADLAITPASLTVTADSKSKVYGSTDPALTYQITSGKLIGTDQLTGGLARDAGENVGNYPITQGTLAASPNYNFTYQKADLAITKASLVGITFNDNSFTYDGTAKSLAIVGLLPKGTTVNYVNNNQSQAGTYTVTANITGGNNYQDQTLTADLTINKATQVITWTQDLTIGCDGENTLVLNATASSDLPVYYTSSNSTIAAVIGNSLTFNKQGFADITAQQDGNNNYLPATHVIKQVNMRLIGKVKKKWEDVLIFDNSSDDFVSWQWYKDGQAIVGAQGQYYTSPTPLNGSYMVVVKDKDGNTMETCPLAIVAGQHKGGVKVVPNPARQGTTFTIKADYPSEELKGAKIMITDITGKLYKEINQVSPEVVTQVPMVPGIYIIYLFLENGKRESVKLLVN